MIIRVKRFRGEPAVWRVIPVWDECPQSLVLATPIDNTVSDYNGIMVSSGPEGVLNEPVILKPDDNTIWEGDTYGLYYLSLQNQSWFVTDDEWDRYVVELLAYKGYLKIGMFSHGHEAHRMEVWYPLPQNFRPGKPLPHQEVPTSWERLLNVPRVDH